MWSKLVSYITSNPFSTHFSNNHDYLFFMFFDFFSIYLVFPSIKHPHSLFLFPIKYVPLQLFIHYAQFEYLILFYCFYRLCLESVYPLQRSTTSVFVCIFFPLSQFIPTLHIQYSRFLSVFCLAPPHYVPGIGRGAKPIVTRYAIAQSNSIGIVLKIME